MKIGFDITQKERGRIFANYQTVRTILEGEKFVCEELIQFPLTLPVLQTYQIILFPCPDSSKLREDEIAAILQYISLGGHVILLNHAGGDQGRRTNLGALTNQCGISFNNDEILDSSSNLGVDSYPLLKQLTPHPIFNDIEDLCFRIGCSLTITGNTLPLAHTSNQADPPNQAVMGLISYGKGRIFASGSYEMFQDEVKGGVEYSNNAKLLKNLINWLSAPESSPPPEPTSPIRKIAPPLSEIPLANKLARPSVKPKAAKSEGQLHQILKDVQKLKEEHQIILKENTELREKLNIIELNLAEFPNDSSSELKIQVDENNSKLKAQSEMISTLKQELSFLKENVTAIERKLITFEQNISSNQFPADDSLPIQPIITTAADLINQPRASPNPQNNPQINACHQLLQILEANFKNGLLTQHEYAEKRFKFEKKLVKLQESS